MRLYSASLAILLLLFSAAGCGSSQSDATGQDRTNGETVIAEGNWAGLKREAGRWADHLLIPHGPSPDKVVIRDLKIGSGAPIRPGDVFAARYVDFDYRTGKLLERDWSQKEPWRLTWQIDELVDAWEPGLKGIRAGGRRELIAPSRLVYENGPRVYIVEAAYIERK